MQKLFPILILVIFGGSLFFYFNHQTPILNAYKTNTIQIHNTDINVDIADTDALRELGLGGRNSLDAGKGMLFVFDTPDTYGFWMKDMKFPIDIVWLDQNRVVSIERSISPASFPKIFYPSKPASFVLELPAGYSDSLGLKINDFFSVKP